MSWRIVVIENQAKLDYKMGYMVVRGLETKRVLLDEIGILLIENPAVSLTGILIEALKILSGEILSVKRFASSQSFWWKLEKYNRQVCCQNT